MHNDVRKMQFEVDGNITEYFKREYEGYKAKGFWGCGKCGNNFTVPNENNIEPWCCPFCGSNDIMKDTKQGELDGDRRFIIKEDTNINFVNFKEGEKLKIEMIDGVEYALHRGYPVFPLNGELAKQFGWVQCKRVPIKEQFRSYVIEILEDYKQFIIDEADNQAQCEEDHKKAIESGNNFYEGEIKNLDDFLRSI